MAAVRAGAGQEAPREKIVHADEIKRRKPAASRRETAIKVLASSEEYDLLKASADEAGLSLSTWLRLAGLATAKGERK